jgi:hypothetical protein
MIETVQKKNVYKVWRKLNSNKAKNKTPNRSLVKVSSKNDYLGQFTPIKHGDNRI